MKTPKLTRKVLRDHERLGDAIDRVLMKSKKRRKLTKKILRLQDRLKRLVSVEAWHVYLKLEEVVNERAIVEQDLLVEWAFESGQKQRRCARRQYLATARIVQSGCDDATSEFSLARASPTCCRNSGS